MITQAPETLEQTPENVEQEKTPSLENSEESLKELRKLFKKPNANPKIRSTDLRYKKNKVLSELEGISLKLIDQLPEQVKQDDVKEQSLEDQFQHLTARHCDAAMSEVGETVDKEIKLPGIYDHSLNISMEKVSENEISTAITLQPTP